MTTSTETVYFRVDLDWATKFARTLWSEHKFDECYSFLTEMGIESKELQNKILAGNLKMVQDPDDDRQGMLAPDDWKPVHSQCQHCVYPDPYCK